jgi:IS1 family transposase
MANVLSSSRRAVVVAALVEGNSIRATVRMTGVAKNTIAQLALELGAACARYQDEALRELSCKRLELEELWGFCYSKQKNVPADKAAVFGYGDVWTFIAIDADTKLCPSFVVGSRDGGTATHFCQDLSSRMVGRVQLTTDGHAMYLEAVEAGFGGDVDYAMLQKIYASPTVEGQKRYSPAECIGCKKQLIQGRPNYKLVSTSYIERQNLTVRMSMRRFTRLTNAFSKKVENLAAAVAIHFMHYNFCRPHMSLKGKTPAQAAGVTSRRWTVEGMVRLLDEGRNPES